MVPQMKRIIEIGEELLHRAKQVLRKEGGTLRGLVEEGLALALKRRERGGKAHVKPVTFRGQGRQSQFRSASWQRIRDAIYPHGRR